jgi:hypothetical protein
MSEPDRPDNGSAPWPEESAGRSTPADVETEIPSSPAAHEGFLPSQPERYGSESVLVRLVATIGVVAIGTAVGAILIANSIAGWISSLVVASVSVALAAVLWRSRRL